MSQSQWDLDEQVQHIGDGISNDDGATAWASEQAAQLSRFLDRGADEWEALELMALKTPRDPQHRAAVEKWEAEFANPSTLDLGSYELGDDDDDALLDTDDDLDDEALEEELRRAEEEIGGHMDDAARANSSSERELEKHVDENNHNDDDDGDIEQKEEDYEDNDDRMEIRVGDETLVKQRTASTSVTTDDGRSESKRYLVEQVNDERRKREIAEAKAESIKAKMKRRRLRKLRRQRESLEKKGLKLQQRHNDIARRRAELMKRKELLLAKLEAAQKRETELVGKTAVERSKSSGNGDAGGSGDSSASRGDRESCTAYVDCTIM